MPVESPTRPVEDTLSKVNNEIAVGSDLAFQRRWWRFEFVAWTLFTTVVILASMGWFGRGHFAKKHVRAADGSVQSTVLQPDRTRLDLPTFDTATLDYPTFDYPTFDYTDGELTCGRSQAPDVAQQHPLAPLPVEGHRAGPGHVQAMPPAEAAARRVHRLWHLQRPSGR